MKNTTDFEPLDDAAIEHRAYILWNVDAQECQSCHAAAEPATASNPAWYMDLEARDGADYAIIRCPSCW